MSLSNMEKDVVTRLMEMISSDDNQLSVVKSDHATYGKLTLLASQIQLLQRQAQEVIAQSMLNARLLRIPVSHTRVPGTTYHLYVQNGRDVLSVIGPSEWDTYEEYKGAFLYGFDHTFQQLDD